MAAKVACRAAFKLNLDNLIKRTQCLTTRVSVCRVFSTSTQKQDSNRLPVPKRPPGPYLLFSNALKPILRQDNPDLKYQDIVRMLSQIWKDMEPSEKKQYEDEYNRRKEAYIKQLIEFTENTSEEQLMELKQKAKSSRMIKHARKRAETVKRPTAVRSPLNFYIKEVCSGENRLTLSEAARHFGNLSEEEKEPYKKKSELDRIRREKELKELEQECKNTLQNSSKNKTK